MECKHDQRKRAVLGRQGGDGKLVYGMPPVNDDEPAWCGICGALWCRNLFGWGWLHPMLDRDAPTLGNILAAAAPGGKIADVRDSLTEREREVLALRFGIKDKDDN